MKDLGNFLAPFSQCLRDVSGASVLEHFWAAFHESRESPQTKPEGPAVETWCSNVRSKFSVDMSRTVTACLPRKELKYLMVLYSQRGLNF